MYYLSIDVEASGPFPGLFSLVSVGAVPVIATKEGWRLQEDWDFYAELKPLEGAGELPAATEVHGLTREHLLEHGLEPQEAMEQFARYLNRLRKRFGRCVPAAWPSSFDSPYVGWYCQKFLGEIPLGYSAFDIASYAQGIFRCGKGQLRTRLSQAGFSIKENPYPHNALRDAREQGILLSQLLNYPGDAGQSASA